MNKKIRKLSVLLSLLCILCVLSGCGAAKYAADEASNTQIGLAMPSPAPQMSTASKSGGSVLYDTKEYVMDNSVGNNSTPASYDVVTPTEDALMEDLNRKLIKTGNLELETTEFDAFNTYLRNQIKTLGGYMESENVTATTYYRDYRVASYTVRIPQSQFELFMDSVCNNATVISKGQNAKDITEKYVDTESHIKTLKIEQERLLALLSTADNIDAIITLEARLSEVRYSLEWYESMLRTYENQVQYSTLNISVTEVLRVTQKKAETLGERMANGISDTFYEIKVGFQNFLVWFVVNLPYLIIWAVILGAAAFLVIRRIKKKRKVHPKDTGNERKMDTEK